MLVILGKKEVEKALPKLGELTPGAREVFENTEQLHDGRWLWIRVFNADDVNSVKLLLNAKRKPKKRPDHD